MRSYYGLFNGVTIKQFSEFLTDDSRYNAGIWDSSPKRYKEVIVMLSVKDSSTGIIIARFSENEITQAIEFSSNIAEKFNVPVSDFLPPNLLKSL